MLPRGGACGGEGLKAHALVCAFGVPPGPAAKPPLAVWQRRRKASARWIGFDAAGWPAARSASTTAAVSSASPGPFPLQLQPPFADARGAGAAW